MSTSRLLGPALGVVLVAVTLGAEQLRTPATGGSSRSAREFRGNPARPAPHTAMSIRGSVRNSANGPVSLAPVRLRDARTGRTVAQTTTDSAGTFVFRLTDAGIYVTELLDHEGRLLAAGDMIAIEIGDSVATVIRLPSRIPVFGWFGDAAGALASAAASAGILAVAATAPPASAVR